MRKHGRERDQRRALLKGLADSLIIHESIETTRDKAKEVVPYTEKLITKAKIGSLHARRQIISGLNTVEAAHKLVDDIAPKVKGRSSGHLRIERTTFRRGDNAELARVSFVDDLSKPAASKSTVTSPQSPVKKSTKPAAKKLATSDKRPVTKSKVAQKGAKK